MKSLRKFVEVRPEVTVLERLEFFMYTINIFWHHFVACHRMVPAVSPSMSRLFARLSRYFVSSLLLFSFAVSFHGEDCSGTTRLRYRPKSARGGASAIARAGLVVV